MPLQMRGRCLQMTAGTHMLRAWPPWLTTPWCIKQGDASDGLPPLSWQGHLVQCRDMVGSKPELLQCTA